MKESISIYPDAVPAGVLALINALTPEDVAEIQRAGVQLSVFAGIGRALALVPVAEAVQAPPATVIDYRPTPAVEPPPVPVQEIPAEPQQEQVAAEREEIGNRLPNERKGNGEAEQNRRKIAALLADRGPMRAAELRAETGISDGLMSYYLNGRPDWFQKLEPANNRSKWNVTAAALAAIGADPRPEVPDARPQLPPAGNAPIGG